MCGCGKGVVFSKSSSKVCQDKVRRLSDIRNKLAILFNITQEEDLKQQYKQDRDDIDNLIKEIYSSGDCPDYSLIVQLENEVNNEFSKYNNS